MGLWLLSVPLATNVASEEILLDTTGLVVWEHHAIMSCLTFTQLPIF